MDIEEIQLLANSSDRKDREKVATNSNLSPEQIEKLYKDYKSSCRHKIKNNIETGTLTQQQVECIFDTKNTEIIGLLITRSNNDNEVLSLVFSSPKKLKPSYLLYKCLLDL